MFSPRRVLWSWAVALAMAAVICMEIYGFSLRNLFAQHIWDDVGVVRLARFTGVFLAAAVPILLMVPWSFAGAAISLVVLGTVVSVGPAAVLAVALFLLASCTVGMWVVGRGEPETWESHVLATLTGMGLYIFLMYLVARVPVNYPVVWAGLQVAPILLDWRRAVRRARQWAGLLASCELRQWPQRCAAAALVFVTAMHWLVVLGPEKGADGLAMHLAIAHDIALHHQFTFQPSLFVWSVMPMGADFAYAIVGLMGGEFAVRLLNLAALLLLLGLLYSNLRRSVSAAVSLLLVTLFATTPFVQALTGSLMVDNMLAAMILGSLSAIWRFGETARKGFLFAAMLLGGAAVSVKLGALSFLAVALPWLVVEIARNWKALRPRPVAVCLLALTMFLLTGLPAYGIAWWKTGNPIFPFKNEKIHSPLLNPAVQFQDNEFRKPLTWTLPFDLTFRSHSYYEGQDGAFGYQYPVFLYLGLLGLLVVPSRRSFCALLVAVGGAILVFREEPNARYLYAAMALLSIPFAALLGWLKTNRRALYAAALGMAVVCCGLNLYFMPGSNWYHKDFHMRSPFSRSGRERYTQEFAPIRTVIRHFNQVHPGAAIFLANDEDVADPDGDVYQGGWHQYSTLEKLRQAHTLDAMEGLFEQWGVRYFTWRKPGPGEHTDPEILAEFLEKCTVAEYQLDVIRLTRLDPVACRSAGSATPPGEGGPIH
jgi:hypothetical protein